MHYMYVCIIQYQEHTIALPATCILQCCIQHMLGYSHVIYITWLRRESGKENNVWDFVSVYLLLLAYFVWHPVLGYNHVLWWCVLSSKQTYWTSCLKLICCILITIKLFFINFNRQTIKKCQIQAFYKKAYVWDGGFIYR